MKELKKIKNALLTGLTQVLGVLWGLKFIWLAFVSVIFFIGGSSILSFVIGIAAGALSVFEFVRFWKTVDKG